MSSSWSHTAKRVKGWKEMKHVFRKVDENRFIQRIGRYALGPRIPWCEPIDRPYYNDGIPVFGGERLRHLRPTREKLSM